MFFRQKTVIATMCVSLLVVLALVLSTSYIRAADEGYKSTLLSQVKNERYSLAYNRSKNLDDPTFKRLIEWFYLNNVQEPTHDFDALKEFLQATKGWPRRGRAVLLAEKKLDEIKDPKKIKEWFSLYKPTTQDALYLYVESLKQEGKQEEAEAYIRDYWVKATLSKKDRQDFYKRYKSDLRIEDHQARLDRLLWDRHFDSAEVLYPLVGKSLANLARARIGLAKGQPGVDLMIQAVAPQYMDDEGLLYERVRWRRDRDKNEGVAELLKEAPKQLKHASSWWRERHIVARRFMSQKEFQKAYDLVSQHNQTGGFSFAQAEWLSGWLALRFLNNPTVAFEHFRNMAEKVSSPVSRSRAYYWKGLAALSLGRKIEAYKLFSQASQFSTRFYGQLAYSKLMEVAPNYPTPPLTALGKTSTKDLNLPKDILEICGYLYSVNLKHEKDLFFDKLVRYGEDEDSFIELFRLAKEFEAYHAQVTLSKKAMRAGFVALDEGYPVFQDVPFDYFNEVEPSLVYGIIRQESAFDPKARSSAGARGLMQLMPGTAKETARKLGVSYRVSKLDTPDYNIRLGSAYISRLINRFEGYYVLAVASYNAGPYRVEKIMEEIGDPRTGEVDIVDWIEMIPIYETRNYVQRVLEAMHIYRSKLQHVEKQDMRVAKEGVYEQ